MSDKRSFSWGDEALLLVWPLDHPFPMFKGDLASCIRQAIVVAAEEPVPGHVEIAHSSPGMIQMDEIRRMAADPSFPTEDEITIEDLEHGPMG